MIPKFSHCEHSVGPPHPLFWSKYLLNQNKMHAVLLLQNDPQLKFYYSIRKPINLTLSDKLHVSSYPQLIKSNRIICKSFKFYFSQVNTFRMLALVTTDWPIFKLQSCARQKSIVQLEFDSTTTTTSPTTSRNCKRL